MIVWLISLVAVSAPVGAPAAGQLFLIGATGRALVFADEDWAVPSARTEVWRRRHFLMSSTTKPVLLDVPAVRMRARGSLPVQHHTYLGASASGRTVALWLDRTIWTIDVRTRRTTSWAGLCAPDTEPHWLLDDGVVACHAPRGQWCYASLDTGARACTRFPLAAVYTRDGRTWAASDDGRTIRVGLLQFGTVLFVPVAARGDSYFADGSLLVLNDNRRIGVAAGLETWPELVPAKRPLAVATSSMAAFGGRPLLLGPRTGRSRLVRLGPRWFVESYDPSALRSPARWRQVRVADEHVVLGPESSVRIGCHDGRCAGRAEGDRPFFYRESDFEVEPGEPLARAADQHFFSTDGGIVTVQCTGIPLGDGELECLVGDGPRRLEAIGGGNR